MSDCSKENQFAAIPLPNEVPPPPDLSALPTHILHAGTVETLIGQNDDLIARLKVNIRRNLILEQQLMEQERVTSELNRINSSLSSQIQVLQEKENIWKEKSSRSDFSESKLKEAEKKIRRLSSYRRRILAWVRPKIDRLTHEKSGLQSQNERLTQNLAAREASLGDLRSRLSEAITHIQSLDKNHTKDQAALVAQYEQRQKNLESELAKAHSELIVVREKAIRVDEAIKIRAELENKIIFLERKNSEMAKALGSEIADFQDQAVKYRQEAKSLALESREYESQLKDAMEKATCLTEENAKLRDQFESLQALWALTQKKLEASEHQQQTLNRLNQELSRLFKQEKIVQHPESTESVQSTEQPTTKLTSTPIERVGDRAGERAGDRDDAARDRIDMLLAALESGFPSSRAKDSIRDLEIVDDENGVNHLPNRDSAASL